MKKKKKKKGEKNKDVKIFDYLWFRLEVDKQKGTVTKKFKTDGKLNGDVLEKK